MHTLQMTLAGLALLALLAVAAKVLGSPYWTMTRAARLFIPLWLVIAIANMLIGILSAGIPFLTELAVLAVVFGVPAAAAWYLMRREQA
ncbi:MAG TPA: hypothetical protein PK264_19160 [Hyphomicrobiaceae bacterium]|nr:hypothetical protein [Hyphomicrobiaceae bacterium]